MALNVEQITSRLAQMPDAALQKYAAMNKNDPYIMALAVSESNRRKQMRQAAQAQQGQAPQPKVVDAVVQSMAAPMPEDMGIARLPAGDMNFADGGIVAFADGGEVERYGDLGFTGYSFGNWAAADKERRRQKLEEERAANMALVNRDSGYAGRGLGILADPLVGAVGTVPVEDDFRRQPDPRMQGTPATPPGTPLQDGSTTLRPAATQRMPGAPTAPAAPAATAATQDAGLAALDPNKLLEESLKKQRGEVRPEKDLLETLNKERTAAAEKELEGERALEKRFADAYKGRRERLAAREGELGKMKDQNLGLALLQAGAAMMSTVGNVGTAVGKGIQAGSQQYVAGLDKLNAAKDKLADARDRLDDLQLNRDEMSARSIQKAENKIRDTAIAGQENMIKYIMERDKVDRETAAKIVDAQIQLGITQLKETGLDRRSANEIQGRITAAKIGNQPPAQMQIAMALGGGDLEAGFRKIKEIEAGKFSVANSYADYLKAFAGKDTMTPPMSFANYAAQFGATLPR